MNGSNKYISIKIQNWHLFNCNKQFFRGMLFIGHLVGMSRRFAFEFHLQCVQLTNSRCVVHVLPPFFSHECTCELRKLRISNRHCWENWNRMANFFQIRRPYLISVDTSRSTPSLFNVPLASIDFDSCWITHWLNWIAYTPKSKTLPPLNSFLLY